MRKVQAHPTGRCWCGCGAEASPGKFFHPMHDSLAFKGLRKRLQGEHGNDGLANILATMGFDSGDNGVNPKEVEHPDSTRRETP
ncbi:MAG: hypothetical protein OXG44_08455 [Gammaproteobacteria bacterium]|nr:hypothetical protein [Gammaproteobacteria bacterium]